MKQPRQSGIYFALLAAIALGTCFRIFICLHFNPVDFLFSDPMRHWVNGARFPKGAYNGAADPIGFQVYVFLLRKACSDNRYVIGLCSALLSGLMPWSYYRAARNFGLAKIPAMVAWAVLAWLPSLLAIYHYLMMETLLLLLDGLALWATARYLRKRGAYAFLIMVLLWSAAVLTKPTVAPLAAVCGLWSWWKCRPSFKTIAAAAGMILVMLIPQSVRTEVAMGILAPFGNPWLTKIQLRTNAPKLELRFIPHENAYVHFNTENVYDFEFMSPSVTVEPFTPLSHWKIRRADIPKKAVITVNSAYGARDWKNAYDMFQPTFAEWMTQWRENIVLFLFAPSWPESESKVWVDGWEPPSRWIWAPLICFVLFGNFRAFLQRRFEAIPIFTTFFTLSMALQNLILFEGRYRKPLEPLLVMNAVWIIATWSSVISKIEKPAATDLTH